jgi:hypothetical protein
MFRTRAAATAIAIAVSCGGATAAFAPAALASSSHAATATAAAGTGNFSTWAAAQKAAGFKLQKPGRLHGLHLTGQINVSGCILAGKPSKRVVTAQYGKIKTGELAVVQNNTGGLCSNLGHSKKLGTVKLHGTTGHLYGLCGHKGEVSCSSKKAEFILTWKKGSDFYYTWSQFETRATLVDFSKSLKNV